VNLATRASISPYAVAPPPRTAEGSAAPADACVERELELQVLQSRVRRRLQEVERQLGSASRGSSPARSRGSSPVPVPAARAARARSAPRGGSARGGARLLPDPVREVRCLPFRPLFTPAHARPGG
jgi:hypothetical protein